ncbi:hypothetical protein CP533_4313 [Ophiocordyceps camponoti-saundersi (nom. inval.)]|nr:hypothetical protein CP533_4313 [Ophiocordyceps camponoti-saundersi (nom. inval.)]
MRLLRTQDYTIEEFAYDQVPEYAILSHRWTKEELSLQDVQGRIFDKKGFDKIEGCCVRARADEFQYVWIDTCCIDKTSSAELSEAINSMYLWYYRAKRCYAHLADVSSEMSVEKSEWFTRGWTLQELLAPSEVYFVDRRWADLGTRTRLQQTISRCTGIHPSILSGERAIETVSIAQRMSWAAKRETTRVEDRAYSLMGIFGINMPLIYGEGERAFIRLQEEIMKTSDDHSLFAWESSDARGGLLASSPAAFSASSHVIQFNPFDTAKSPLTVSSRGVFIDLRFIGCGKQGLGMAVLHCKKRGDEDKPLAIYLRDHAMTMERFSRVWCEKMERLDMTKFRASQYPVRRLYIRTERMALTRKADDVEQRDEAVVSEQVYSIDTITKMMDFTNPMALLHAAQRGHEDTLWMLLTRRDMDINLRRSDGHTALSLAVENHKGAIVKALLARNDVKTNLECAVKPAVASGDFNIVKQLLHSDKVDVNSKGKGGKTALHYAVLCGSIALVKLLLENGFNVGEMDVTGRRPLHHAVERGQEAIVRLLMDVGADVEVEDKSHLTPLIIAIQKGNATMVEMLLDHGAGVEAKRDSDKTPLTYALDREDDAIVRLLLDRGAVRDWRCRVYSLSRMKWTMASSSGRK